MLLSVAQAEAEIRAAVPLLPTEDCPLAAAAGRVLRESIVADRDLPPYDRATLDGIAVAHAALAAGQRTFRLEGTQAAGMVRKTVSDPAAGAFEIMTGAVVPVGTDTVVPLEDLELADGVATLRPGTAVLPRGYGVHARGSDAAAGQSLIAPGAVLGSRELAVAAAVGRGTLRVALWPRVAVLTTGDELVEVNAATIAPHQVRRSNDHALRAALLAAGVPHVDRFHARDLPDDIAAMLRRLLADYDWLLLCGGVSKGRFDHLPALLAQLGVERRFHGVAQRPGKPMWFGLSPRRQPVFALPGNPVSALVCCHRYVLPALARAAGAAPAPVWDVTLAGPVHCPAPLTWFMPVRLHGDGAGGRRAEPDPFNTSGDFTGLLGTDGFVELPRGPGEHNAGETVPFWPWR
jgi:molybdopterin molybdotransferase